LYGTKAMADEVNMSLEEYRNEIVNACYLDKDDPIAEWKTTIAGIEKIKNALNTLPIETIHVEGEDADITFTLGRQRQRVGGSGRNIPSFEIFTSPDRRGTNGWMRFNQPLYSYGQVIKDVYLRFKDGLVVDFDASENKELLKEMINIPNANKV